MRLRTAPTSAARECQWSRTRFCGRAENALYSYRHCMTNLWISTKQRWSIVCRNSWMAVSPQAHRRQTKQKHTTAPFGIQHSSFYLKIWWKMSMMLKGSVGTLHGGLLQEWLYAPQAVCWHAGDPSAPGSGGGNRVKLLVTLREIRVAPVCEQNPLRYKTCTPPGHGCRGCMFQGNVSPRGKRLWCFVQQTLRIQSVEA